MIPTEVLIDLVKNQKVLLSPGKFENIDENVRNRIIKWVHDDLSDIPIEELGLEECVVAFVDRVPKLYFFYLYYDGSYTGTDPCYGELVFNLEGTVSKLVYNNIECAS